MQGKKGQRAPWTTYYRASEGKWIIKYRDGEDVRQEERIPKEEASDKEQANRYAARWYPAYRRNLLNAGAANDDPSALPKKTPLLRDFSERWLAMRKQLMRAGLIKPATHKQDKSAWSVHIEPALGNVPIDRVTKGVIRPFVRALCASHAPLTVHNIVNVLTVMLDDIEAEEWYPLPFNHARHRKVREVLPPRVKRAGRNVVIHVDQAQTEKLLKCPHIPVRRRLRYLVALLVGLRDGEIAALRFCSLRSMHGIAFVSVTQALSVGETGRFELLVPKSEESVRMVPVHPAVAEALAWWKEHGWVEWVGRKATDQDFIFPNFDGKQSRPRSAEKVRRDLAFAGLATTFQDSNHNIVFHSLRATFCTWLEEADASEAIRARLMGQGAVSTADAHYTSKAMKRLKAAIEGVTLAVTLQELTTFARPPKELKAAVAKLDPRHRRRREPAPASAPRPIGPDALDVGQATTGSGGVPKTSRRAGGRGR